MCRFRGGLEAEKRERSLIQEEKEEKDRRNWSGQEKDRRNACLFFCSVIFGALFALVLCLVLDQFSVLQVDHQWSKRRRAICATSSWYGFERFFKPCEVCACANFGPQIGILK